jgi:hypothetical protein
MSGLWLGWLPGAAQTPKIENVAWSASGWLLGRPAPRKLPKSKMSLGRGWVGLGARGCPDSQKSKMWLGRGPGLGRPGPPGLPHR